MYQSFGLPHNRNCSVKDGALSGATPLEAGMDTNVQHLKKHVPSPTELWVWTCFHKIWFGGHQDTPPRGICLASLCSQSMTYFYMCAVCVLLEIQTSVHPCLRIGQVRLDSNPVLFIMVFYCRYACCNIWHSPYAIPLQMKNKSFKISYISILQIDC